MLKEANEAVDQELRREARENLEARVEDWKHHQIDHFGELLLHGHFPVVTGKTDGQKEVRFPFISRMPVITRSSYSIFQKCNRPQRKAPESSVQQVTASPDSEIP